MGWVSAKVKQKIKRVCLRCRLKLCQMIEQHIRPINGHSQHIYLSLVLFQPRKTRPYLTERLMMGRKESNQTNKQYGAHWRA